MHAPGWQRLHRLLVADKGLPVLRQPGHKRVILRVRRHCTAGRTDRFAVSRLADIAAQMLRQNAKAIATAHKGMIGGDDGRHQRHDRRLDPGLLRGFVRRGVAHTAGAAADNDPGICRYIKARGQRLSVQPDAVCAAL